jgi:glutaredoxin
MEIVKVPGKNNKDKVFLYTLSTCIWCKRTRQFLKDNEIEFEYVDVDLCNQKDLTKIKDDILNLGGRLSFPVTIINDSIMINGFNEEKIKEALGL